MMKNLIVSTVGKYEMVIINFIDSCNNAYCLVCNETI